jgi:excisionase family DNA binding protein
MSEQRFPMLLTVDETASVLRTSRKAVYSMIDRWQLPGVIRIGRRVLIHRDVLLQWLDHNRTPSPMEDRR